MSKQTTSKTNDNCLNCGKKFLENEKFCPECGQKNKGSNLKLNDFIREVFAGFFSWDAKFWRTLLPLIIQPGKISKEYVEGKRVRFTNPFRFFFIISVIFFFLVKLNDKNKVDITDNDKTAIKIDSLNNTNIFGKNIDKHIAFQKKYPNLKTEIALDSLNEKPDFLNKLIYNKAKTINNFAENTGESTNKLISLGFSYLSTAFLFLLPVFAFVLKIIYIRRKFNYMNHLIFIFHVSTFFFICLTLFQFMSLFYDIKDLSYSFITPSIILVFGIYPFIAMKVFYKQSYLKTFFKLTLISIVFSILTTLTISLIFLLAFFMM